MRAEKPAFEPSVFTTGRPSIAKPRPAMLLAALLMIGMTHPVPAARASDLIGRWEGANGLVATATIRRGSRNSEFLIATLSSVVHGRCAGEVTVYGRPEGPNPNRMRGKSYVEGDAAGS